MIDMLHMLWLSPGDALLTVLIQFGIFVLVSLAFILGIIWVRVPVRHKKNGRAGKDNRP